MSRLELDIETFAFKLFRDSSRKATARIHGLPDAFYTTKVIDREIPDIEEFIQDALDARIDGLKALDDSHFFRLKRCLIDVESDRYEYRMGTSDQWERQ
jgi:hypothetical protein